jgi:hypothetical protein
MIAGGDKHTRVQKGKGEQSDQEKQEVEGAW